MFDQHVARNSMDSIVPDLATSWAWSDDGKQLSFKLRQGVKWHDGKPFTAKDVACTFESRDRSPRSCDAARARPGGGNLEKVTVESDFDVTIHLKHRQPALLALLASGYTPIYPCHIPTADMRRKPVGTGPFKFVEFKMNEGIKLVRNPDYWKPGRPYLDGIEFTIIPDRSTRMLSFIAGKFDMTFVADVSVPLLKTVKKDAPNAQCVLRSHRGQHEPDRQPRQAAVRRSQDAPRHGADPRPPGLHRHPRGGSGADERRPAAAAGRRVGPDARRC